MLTATLNEFRTDPQAHFERLRQTGEPEVLTVDGEAQGVVLSTETFDDMERRLERAETIEMIRVGKAQMDAGLGRPLNEVFREIAHKNGLKWNR